MSNWRPVLGFEGLYEVSDDGQVRSLDRHVADGRLFRGKLLRPGVKRPTGHLLVSLYRNGHGTTRAVHRLVLESFVGPRPRGSECRHGNGQASDNRLANLAWGSRSENHRDAVRHGTHNNASKTRCPRNHPYDEQNTLHTRGQRVCRTCRKGR